MKTHIMLRAAHLLLTLIPVARADNAPVAPAGKPNVLFILIDDMGWRDVGFMGSKYYETPNIDKLAGGGFRFTQGYAPCTVCSPTRASILTGQYPARLHLTDWIPGQVTAKNSVWKTPDWTMQLPHKEVTLAEAFKAAGYTTASIGKWHLGGKGSLPTDHGFDLNIGGAHAGQPASYFFPYGKPGDNSFVPGLQQDGGPGEYLTDRLTKEAQKFITTQHQAGKPFFLYLPHYGVHSPWQAKPELIAKYKGHSPDGGQKNPTYAAMVESIDDSVGALMKTLDELGIRDNTVVVFTSDNGGVMYAPITDNAPLRGGKGNPYEGGIRDPMVISWPGRIPAGESAVPMLSMDFYPTLLELAAVKQEAKVDGVSLVPLLTGKPGGSKIAARDSVFWHFPHYRSHPGQPTTPPNSTMRHGDWKLIQLYTDAGKVTELYNLQNDPGEKTDLAAKEPERVKAMLARLENWQKEVGAQLPERR
jgi:arylsulfatase A